MAPPKPSKQTQILLDNMSKSAEEEKTRWDQVMENFDLLFSQVNEIGVVQQQMKSQMDIRGAAMDQYLAEQHMITQQVKANGAAVAQLTMNSLRRNPNLVMIVQVLLLMRRMRPLTMCLPSTREPTSLNLLRKESLHQSLIGQLLYLPNPCPICNFPSLMVPTQRSGRIIVRAISNYINYSKVCG